MAKRQQRNATRSGEQALEEATTPTPQHAFGSGFVIGAILAVSAVLFVAQNTQSVELHWLFFDWSMPLWITLLVALLAGAAIYPLAAVELRRIREHRTRRQESIENVRRAVRNN